MDEDSSNEAKNLGVPSPETSAPDLYSALQDLYNMVNYALDSRDALLISKTCATMDKVRTALALANDQETSELRDNGAPPPRAGSS